MRGPADRRGGGHRPLRVGRDLHRRLAQALAEGVGDPPRSLVLTRVRMSSDLGHARVFYVTDTPSQETDTVLTPEDAQNLARALRRSLAHGWPLRRLPEIALLPDEEWRAEERVFALLHGGGGAAEDGDG